MSISLHSAKNLRYGFTIVELLIVIVVISILATISITTYQGIQQRANNASIVDAVNKTLRLTQAYVAINGTYPLSGGDVCITQDVGCNSGAVAINGSATLDTNMATIGALPRNMPVSGTNHFGMWFTYSSSQTLGGTSQPLRLTYYLFGINQNCGASNVVQYTWPNFTMSATGYTVGNHGSSGKTLCWVSVPGPSS